MRLSFVVCGLLMLVHLTCFAQYPPVETKLDRRVKEFLQENENNWSDMNVPIADGKALYDLVLKHNYRAAMEIGTSTGHSAIWIAWALSKTGGKLITIEIDKKRYLQARANFKKAGLSKYIDVRLADAHKLVPQLEGPFDFVFCDADKIWYKNYFQALETKIVPGGCFVAHNARLHLPGIREFLGYVRTNPGYRTEILDSSRAGLSVSYRLPDESDIGNKH